MIQIPQIPAPSEEVIILEEENNDQNQDPSSTEDLSAEDILRAQYCPTVAQNVWDASFAALTAIDQNADNELTLTEMQEYTSEYDVELDDEEVFEEFVALDENEDEVVSLSEICDYFNSAYADVDNEASVSLLHQ